MSDIIDIFQMLSCCIFLQKIHHSTINWLFFIEMHHFYVRIYRVHGGAIIKYAICWLLKENEENEEFVRLWLVAFNLKREI